MQGQGPDPEEPIGNEDLMLLWQQLEHTDVVRILPPDTNNQMHFVKRDCETVPEKSFKLIAILNINPLEISLFYSLFILCFVEFQKIFCWNSNSKLLSCSFSYFSGKSLGWRWWLSIIASCIQFQKAATWKVPRLLYLINHYASNYN